MLRRLGSKTKLLPKLLELFPKKITTFIDLFMGSGAVTFAMIDRAKFIISNDNDKEVFNLFMVAKNRQDDLLESFEITPVHEDLFKYWKNHQETDDVWRAVRFLTLSNLGYLGNPNMLRIDAACCDKRATFISAKEVLRQLKYVTLMCKDFRCVLPKISFHEKNSIKEKAFIYADPPYIGTQNNYQESFTKQDTQDLFELLTGSGIRFALSEFDNPFILDLAEKHGLQVTELGERQNLMNRRTEILITNYEPIKQQASLFDLN